MKRYLFLLLTTLLFIVGCSDKVENRDEKSKEKSNTSSETEEVDAENKEEQDFSGPLIDENNNVDEREPIEAAFNMVVLRENKSMLRVKYDIDTSETIQITVQDHPHFSTETINETETKAGISVTEFGIDGAEDTRYFGWTDGTYEYAIDVLKESKILTEDDIYEIIDQMMG